MSVRHLEAPLDLALAAASAELVAAPPGATAEWRLASGTHVLAAGVSIQVPGRRLTLVGEEGCKLEFEGGGLRVVAGELSLRELTIESANGSTALAVDAARISVSDVSASATLAGEVVAVDLASGEGDLDVQDLIIVRAKGDGVIGLRAIGGHVRATTVSVSDLDSSTSATALRLGALAALEAVELEVTRVTATTTATGVLVAAGGRLEVAKAKASSLRADGVTGVAVLGFGNAEGSASVVDVEVSNLEATARAQGLLVATPRRVTVRGFSVTDVKGGAASGVVVAGGGTSGATEDESRDPDVEVGFGSVERVSSSNGDASGVRVLASPSPRPVVVRDVEVAGVVGAPVPASSLPTLDADGVSVFQGWAESLLADLRDDGVPRAEAPALLAATDVVGLSVVALVDEVAPFLDSIGAGDIAVVDSLVDVVSGTGLRIEGGLRPAWVRRTEVGTALHAGFLQADRLIVANTTWDRLGEGVRIGPGGLEAYDSIFSRVAGPPLLLDPDADLDEGRALFADASSPDFEELGELPYRSPGATGLPAALLLGALPPPESIDRRLRAESKLHAFAVAPPPDDLELTSDDRLFVGAHPPNEAVLCDLYDPLPPSLEGGPIPFQSSPVVDYRARDARSLLTVMLERARLVMAPWTDRGPADFSTMLLEAVAERLDHLSYEQERAVAEGFLEDARLRRSVEDHVRPLDYEVDQGLSSSVLLEFSLNLERVAALATAREQEAASTKDAGRAAALTATLSALRELAEDGALEIPAGTLCANARDDEEVIGFTTEEPLTYFPSLARIRFTRDVPQGATSALLEGRLEKLAVGRWLVLFRGHGLGGHVVRVTSIERGTDTTEIGWDPRRPLPWPLLRLGEREPVVLGNVVIAHHGVSLSALGSSSSPSLQRFAPHLQTNVHGGPGVEVALPFFPVSRWASGYPLPGEAARRGRPMVRAQINDDEWARVDDLSEAGAHDEVFALRSSADGRECLRFGDGISSAALPSRENRVSLDLSIGKGRVGNVGEGIVKRLLHVPLDTERGPLTGWLFREDMDVVREFLTVDNPIPAIGGRDPESLSRIRYRAPLLASRPLSAVTPEDYALVARQMPEVAGAHARVLPAAVRPVVSVTVLLRDEDALDPDERLRRWARVRDALEQARLLGFDVESVPPRWAPLDLDVVVDADPHADAGTVREGVIAAVSGNGGLLDPDTSGLGGDVQLSDLYRAAQSVRGVGAVRVRRFRRLEPGAPERLRAGFIRIRADEVAVVRGPARPAADGVLTVTVCGGLR